VTGSVRFMTTGPNGSTLNATQDVAQMSAVIAAFLAAVSFPPGGRPEYDAIRDVFVDGGLLVKNSGDVPEISTVDEFIEPRRKQVDSGELASFEELEIAHLTEVFGNVGHRLSSYAKRGELGGVAIDVRGVIVTQFIRTPAGWRITSMAWDDERPGLVIPERYL